MGYAQDKTALSILTLGEEELDKRCPKGHLDLDI
jgi:hypothetical protein